MTTHLPANAAGRALRAVLDLPEPARSVFVLIRLEGWRFHDAATCLRLPLGDAAHELVKAEAALLRAKDGGEPPENCEGPSYGPGMRVGAMMDRLPPNVALAIAGLVSAAANAEPQS